MNTRSRRLDSKIIQTILYILEKNELVSWMTREEDTIRTSHSSQVDYSWQLCLHSRIELAFNLCVHALKYSCWPNWFAFSIKVGYQFCYITCTQFLKLVWYSRSLLSIFAEIWKMTSRTQLWKSSHSPATHIVKGNTHNFVPDGLIPF